MNLLYRLHDPALPFARLDPRREVTHLLAALMEAMWIAPWFAIALPAARMLPATDLLTVVALNLVAALLLVRLLDARGVYEHLRQFVFIIALFFAYLWALGVVFPPQAAPPVIEAISDNISAIERITFPPLIPVVALVSLVWWRGLRLALITPTPLRIAFGMRLGILSFFVAAIAPQARAVALTALPPFFFFGLLGVSFARALALRELGSQSSSFGPRWAGFMVLTAGGITALGLLIAGIIGGLDPDTFADIIQPIVTGFVFLVAFLMTPIFFVVGKLVEAIVTALQESGALDEIVMPEVTEPLGQGDPIQTSQLEETFRRFVSLLDQIGGVQMCVSVLVVLIVVALIVLTIRRQQRATQSDPEEREDLDGDALAGLRDMFRWGRDAFNSALHTINRFGVGRDLFAALTVRRIYAQMVKTATEEGYPRAVSQTPYEYRDTLAEAFPAGQEAAGIITEAYVRVHYGEVPENSEALNAVSEALARFKAVTDT